MSSPSFFFSRRNTAGASCPAHVHVQAHAHEHDEHAATCTLQRSLHPPRSLGRLSLAALQCMNTWPVVHGNSGAWRNQLSPAGRAFTCLPSMSRAAALYASAASRSSSKEPRYTDCSATVVAAFHIALRLSQLTPLNADLPLLNNPACLLAALRINIAEHSAFIRHSHRGLQIMQSGAVHQAYRTYRS